MTRRTRTWVGASLVGTGGLLVALVGFYAFYSFQATSSLGELIVDRPSSLDQILSIGAPSSSSQSEGSLAPGAQPQPGEAGAEEPSLYLGLVPREAEPGALPEGRPGPDLAAPEPGTTYPMTELIVSGGTLPAAGTGLRGVDLQAFQRVDWSRLSQTLEALPPPQRIEIPAIGLDSSIVELGTTWVGERLVWETPRHLVGHHRGTGNPGESGNTVLSGHISTPLQRQGSVFKSLPKIPGLLQDGRAVEIILTTREARYLYRVVSTEVSKPRDVDLFRPTTEPSLTLITCVPDFVYSDRFLVNAILVGKAPLP